MCEISVIMPISTVERCMRDATKSVLNQSFADFELILTDSHPVTDEALSMVRSFDDQRIRITGGNDCMKSASGKYIATMHAN